MTTRIDADDLAGAVDYNTRRMDAGLMPPEEVAELVALLQEWAPEELVVQVVPVGKNLNVDAKYGDLTRRLREAAFRAFARADSSPAASPPPAPAVALPSFAKTVIDVATAEIGNGEDAWDNSGPDIVRYRSLEDRYLGKNLGKSGHWCAFFQIWCFREALRRLGLPDSLARALLFHDDTRKDKLMPIGGARDMVRRLASDKGHGLWVARQGKLLTSIKPGDYICHRYDRSDNETRGPAHVYLAAAVHGGMKVTTIEGNLGKAPAKVKYVERDLANLPGSAQMFAIARWSP